LACYKIDDAAVTAFDDAVIIIAHKSGFDRTVLVRLRAQGLGLQHDRDRLAEEMASMDPS
jgi:hypothetical protein